MGNVIMYRRIYNELLEKIKNGIYLPGNKMPTEKELSLQYKVSRITSKRAMDMLAEAGYIERSPGSGSFVKSISYTNLNENSQLKSTRKIIGVILDGFGNDFGCQLLKTIERECARRNYIMVLKCTYGQVEEENLAIQSAMEIGASGLILMCVQGESYNSTILKLALDKFPMILVDRQMKGVPIPCVKTDNYEAAKELTDILIKRGHSKITFVTHKSVTTSTITERHGGFTDCILNHHNVSGNFMQIDEFNTTPDGDQKEYEEQDILKIKEAIINNNNNDYTAYLVAEFRLARLIKRAMDEVQLLCDIVTFDGIDFLDIYKCEFICVKQNEYLMGKKAVCVLDRIIKGNDFRGNINVPHEIIMNK